MCKVRDLNYEVELKVDITFKRVTTLKAPNCPKIIID